jgi:hypothetical protein
MDDEDGSVKGWADLPRPPEELDGGSRTDLAREMQSEVEV